MWAIIGGSGFENFDGFSTVRELARETPFGDASSGLREVVINGQKALFIPRHGGRHELLPSEVNYRANVFALKKYGARSVVSFSAVGSLRTELEPEDLVIPLQYVDRTKGIRRHTFCGDGVVGHVSLAHPVCESLVRGAEELARAESIKVHRGGTYVCIEGPHFSTLAESLSYRDLSADIIGMTGFPEYALAREAGLNYLPCCFVTDYDCWDVSRPHVTLDEVIRIMKRNNAKAFALLGRILSCERDLTADCRCAEQGLRVGLMTAREALSPAQREWLQVLTE